MRIPDLVPAIRFVVTAGLGGIGAAAGFTHTHDWASMHWQHGWLAWADAVVIEGMAVVAGFEIHRDHTARRTGRATVLPKVVLVTAFLVQMTAQVAQAQPTPAGWLLAAMPALGFLTVVKLSMRHITDPPRPQDPPQHSTTPSIPEGGHRPSTVDTTAQSVSPAIEPPRASALGRLPAAIRQNVTTTAEQAHTAGRPITAADVLRTVTLPEAMLAAVVAELNDTVNHHPATDPTR